MKTHLIGVIEDVQLGTLAFAIALGLSLVQLVEGIAYFLEALSVSASGHNGFPGLPQYGFSLTWGWGGRIFSFGQLVNGLIEVIAVLLVAALVRRRSTPPV